MQPREEDPIDGNPAGDSRREDESRRQQEPQAQHGGRQARPDDLRLSEQRQNSAPQTKTLIDKKQAHREQGRPGTPQDSQSRDQSQIQD